MRILDFYEEVRKAADIVEVIGEYLSLKREGSNYKTICPFHGDTDPSLSVSPSKQIWKCFGCGKGGDVIKFVAEYENISYFEAAKRLASKYGIKVPTYGNKKRSPYEEALLKVSEFYKENLFKFKHVRDYLLKKRKISPEWIKEFQLGFSPTGEALVEFAKKEGIFETLKELGHIVDGKRGPIDLFWNRITIPIFDLYGRLRGFAGRRMDDYKPKYLNSKNSDWFSKELALFGINRAKNYIKDRGRVILVEGFFDVIRLHLVGFGETISTLGTSLTEGQMRIIRKLAEKVYLVFDGDRSGIKAAVENAEKLFGFGIEPYLIFLPQGVDPDDFLKEENTSEFRRLLDNAKHFGNWFIDSLKKASPEIREKRIKKFLSLLRGTGDEIKYGLWLKELEKSLGVKLKEAKVGKFGSYAEKAVSRPKKRIGKAKKNKYRFKGKRHRGNSL